MLLEMTILYLFLILSIFLAYGAKVESMGLKIGCLYLLSWKSSPFFWTPTWGVSVTLDKLSWLLQFLTILIFFWSLCLSTSRFPAYLENLVIVMASLLLVTLLFFQGDLTWWFYFLFEVSLVPMSLIIIGWGYQMEKKLAAFFAFLMYTVSCSLPLLLMIALLQSIGEMSSFKILSLMKDFHSSDYMSSFTWFFFLAFLVKLPLYGLHLWLPLAHVEAPVMGSMILAAILLKLGAFGLYKFSFSGINSSAILSIALFSLFAVNLICLQQSDLKVLIAYSSVAHMGLAAAAVISNTWVGNTACLLMLMAHGFSSSLLFLMAYLIYESSKSRSLLLIKGLLHVSPFFSLFWFLALAASMGAPPSLNLIAEGLSFFLLLSLSKDYLLVVILASFTAGAYSMWVYAMTTQFKSTKWGLPPIFLDTTTSLVVLSHSVLGFLSVAGIGIML